MMKKGFNSLTWGLVWMALFQISTAQKSVEKNTDLSVATNNSPVASNIIQSSNELLPITLKNAAYNPAKAFLPYYTIQKETPSGQIAIPVLNIKRVAPVNGTYSTLLKKNFDRFLSSEFSLTDVSGFSGSAFLNTYQLVPFRKTMSGSYEELLDYSITWKLTSGTQRLATPSSAFKSNSILATGTWYKIGLTKSGVYKLDKNFLTAMGVNISSINPKNIRIYGNGGTSLPLKNNGFRYDDLEENTIEVIGESDNTFDNGDYVLFYATGSDNWKHKPLSSELHYEFVTNYGSDSSFYFVNFDLGPGKRFNSSNTLGASLNLSHNRSSNSYDFFDYHELNTTNFLKSGREFFGEYFDINNSYSFNFQSPNLVLNDTARVYTSMIARSNNLMVDFTLNSNGFVKSDQILGPNLNFSLADYGSAGTLFLKYLNNNANNISASITKTSGSGTVGWLDKVIVNARRNLVFNGSQFNFRDERIIGSGNICEYTLTNNSTSTVKIWNVTNRTNPVLQTYNANGNILNFKASSDSLIEYVLFSDASALVPKYIGTVANQNLHSIAFADYVIVCPPQFLALAQRLAKVHQLNEGLTYAIATTTQIYNEFSSGRTENTAIRDFARMIYSRSINGPDKLKYLLLMGDGSFRTKEWYLSNNTSLVPVYQTKNSLSITNSVVSDDFFGMMDANEGPDENDDNISMGVMDVGVGRFPAKSFQEAEAIVNKIELYYRKNPNFNPAATTIYNKNEGIPYPQGDWRQVLTFVADDEDNSEHMRQADDFARSIEEAHPQYNIEKIFLDAYQQISTPGGQRYPDAYTEMQNRIQKGTLVYNYTGHGGEVGLTAERFVDIPTINGWNNIDKLPLFITGTCEFSRYDDPDRTSAGELCVLNHQGGAVSMITTVRIAFSTINASFNQKLIDFLYTKNQDGTMPALGDVIRKTKAYAGSNPLNMNFHLLGDPALVLAYPKFETRTNQVNNTNVTLTKDTISGLEKVTVKGYVSDSMGNKLGNFNGIIYPTVYDKSQQIVCLLNDQTSIINGGPFRFNQRKSVLYRGKARVNNGDFEFSFIVPKDVNTAYGLGKISYYAHNGQEDAGGFCDSVVIGGFNNNAVADADGPSIKLFMNDKRFVNGGTTDENPIMLAELFDVSGFNISGNGIGHEMTAILDENTSKPVILNDYYEASLDDYQSGGIRYPFKSLSSGQHKLSLKVWDIQNNSSTTSVDFVVAEKAEMALNHVLNYPNPFSTRTKFFFEHNQANTSLDVNIQIFTVSGKLAKTIKQTVKGDSFRPEGIEWDGRDDYGDKLAKGVYIYKVQISDNQNKKAEKIEKLVILN